MIAPSTSASVTGKAEASITPERELPRLYLAGAGAAGTALARALGRTGWPLGEVGCRTAARARERHALIGGGEPVDFATLARPGRDAGALPVLLLVAVPDRHIGDVAQALAERRWPDGSAALHLSGAVEVDALSPLRDAGLATGGLHPLKSFVDPARDAESLAGTVAALEGDARALAVAELLASRLGMRPFRLTAGMRPAWHAGAAHACNHFVALLDQALDLLAAAGLPRDAARAALLPLLHGTLENLAARPPAEALTGPVVRGDTAAVARHLLVLQAAAPDVRAAYCALALRALALAEQARGLDPALAAELRAALEHGASGRARP